LHCLPVQASHRNDIDISGLLSRGNAGSVWNDSVEYLLGPNVQTELIQIDFSGCVLANPLLWLGTSFSDKSLNVCYQDST
jgi:hypothetical protein